MIVVVVVVVATVDVVVVVAAVTARAAVVVVALTVGIEGLREQARYAEWQILAGRGARLLRLQ